MSYRLAKSLERLREQINAAAPSRKKVSDGWIGDARHRSNKSDHNPHVRDGNIGVVTALDITHDPANGVHGRELGEALIASRDPRIKYVISEGQICSSKVQPWKWRRCTGANGHFHHVHISVEATKSLYDSTKDWAVTECRIVSPSEVLHSQTVIRKGDKGGSVKLIQELLGLTVDGDFGPKTEKAVKEFQTTKGLTADGIVGPATWAKLL